MRKRLVFLVFSVVVSLMLCVVLAAYAADQKPIQWKFQDTYSPDAWPYQLLNKPFIQWLEKASNGRLKIAHHPPGAMASVADTYDSLSRGVFEMAALYPGFYTGVMPAGNVEQGLPWAWTDAKSHVCSLFKFGLFDLMSTIYLKHNIKLIAHYPMGDTYHIGTIKPITKLDDLKGMKIRAVGVYADYVKAIGASPVSIPYGELYMALKMGTIDGYFASSGALVSNKLGEVVKNFLLPTTNSIGFVVGVNKNAWDSLPADLRNMVQASAPMVAVGISAIYAGVVENAIKVAKEQYGVKFTTLSEADQRKATQLAVPIWEATAKENPDCAKAVEAVKKTREYLGRDFK